MQKPIRDTDEPKGLRQRPRADGSWRIWWEPTPAEKALGFSAVELDPTRPTWSINQAKTLNKEVEQARAGKTPVRTGPGGHTIDALIADYKRSRHYTGKKPGTLRSYNTNLNAIGRKWGSEPVASFTKPVMDMWYETLLNNSGADYARQLVGMMSILFTHAERRGWRPERSNPCFNLGIKTATRRDRVATWEEFDALLTAADKLGWPAMAAAIGIATLNPPRQGDVISAKLDDFNEHQFKAADGCNCTRLVWGKNLQKRGNQNVVPIHQLIEQRIRNLKATASEGQEYLLLDPATGRPYTGDLFRKRWASIRAAAAKACPSLTEEGNTLQFRDLRRTFGAWARAAGASKGDVGDVLGNSAGQNPTLAGIYMPPTFYTALRAIDAVQRPQKDERKKA